MNDELVQLQSSCYQKNLLNAMWHLRNTGILCDVTVQVDYQGELEEFEAHQVVLAASSGYFKSLLLADGQVKKIFLCDISTNAFTKFLEYAYSGSVEVERHYVNTILQMAKFLDCQELVDVCLSEVLDYDAETANVSLQNDGADVNSSRAEVKTKQERVRGAIKRKKLLKSPKKLENMKETEQDIQGRRSSRLAGRRVSVDFPMKKSKIQMENPDKSKTAGEEQASADPEVESKDGETVAEKEAYDDSGSETPHSIQEEDPQESDFLPNEVIDEADESEKESRRGSAKYRCEQCSRSFYYEKSYLKHLSVSHGVKTNTTFRCDICQQTFANRCNLKIHQRHVHNDERLFPCDVCDKTFKRKKDVTRHKRQVHEGGTDRHFCHICGKALSSKTALTLHERTHSGHKPFKCNECGSSFSQSSALKTHQRIHTGEKPFACDLCDARFTQNHMLSYHRRCHTGEKPFMCENCGKSFASKEYLKHHNRIHSGLRPYKCETCGRAFAQRNSLHQHMKIHTGERPYHCKDCNKLFTQLNALQRHQRIHTGEKPYMCSMCGRTFTDKSTVRRHTLTHDKQTPWKNYLVVLKGNVEDRVKKPKGASQKKDKTVSVVPEPQTRHSDTVKTQEVVAVSGEPVTISGDWAGTGTIALVSHTSLGGLTVIQTEVPAGTQLQPIVTADGTSVISLDASAVGMPVTVPFSIPISVAHSITVSPSISGSVPITVSSHVSEAILAPAVIAATSEAETTEAILDPAPVPLPTSDECVMVEVTQVSDSQQEVTEVAQTVDHSNSIEISTGENTE
ncbi:GDNF-inducible zinc finger protein 1-like [Myxocyprinus asiaticus]|uniref:GDNF-inducible zinc finger protein 1-like n=1 Tax=Myxocyprinus asiaticus TaxID=70543 RepID=UPI0022219342|nr:GDNF-inducible zinc finger protein 1-like [Myxocyprinus asiaticus]XP_051510388.1 GDNF-inducible zinc finger protein 1-like [Myxocyprinus asiaticus]